MSEKVYDVPADWAKRAFVNDATYQEMFEASQNDPNAFWAKHGKRIELVDAVHEGAECLVRSKQGFDQVVRGWPDERRGQLY